ncbi:MAG: SpoIIE family protein phosphatase [Armatimonadetes bacterium]|nr:SpoIIE family protein phosphatase [Armatimonadota bacterium]
MKREGSIVETEITRERERLQTVLQTVPSGIIVVEGPEARITFMNTRSQEFFGERPEIGQPLPAYLSSSKLMHPDGSPFKADELPINRSLRYGEVVRGEELVIESESGQKNYLLLGSAPLFDSEGRVYGAVASTEDITALREAEEALRQAYARERRVSETLQRALLPNVPDKINGIRLATSYRAALEEAEIGGDFFDVFRPAPDLVGIVIGDVAGKGVEAATHTAFTRHTLRAYAYVDPSPARVMARLGEVLIQEMGREFFVTVFYGVLNERERTLCYANAGHEAPLCVSADHEQVTELSITGIPLGIETAFACEQRTISTEDIARLVLYTDGVTETRRRGELYGLGRLKEFVLLHANDSPRQLVDLLIDEVDDFSGRHLRDDIALLVVDIESQTV